MLGWMERRRCNGLSQSSQIWWAVASHCSWACSVQLDMVPSGHMITLSTTILFSYEDFSESSLCLKHVSAINYSQQKDHGLSSYCLVVVVVQSPSRADSYDSMVVGGWVVGSPSGSSAHGISQARILTRVGCHFLLQGIFLTQRSNARLPPCRQILYRLSHQGSPEATGNQMLHNLAPTYLPKLSTVSLSAAAKLAFLEFLECTGWLWVNSPIITTIPLSISVMLHLLLLLVKHSSP